MGNIKEWLLGTPPKATEWEYDSPSLDLSYDAAQNQPANTIPGALPAASFLPPTRSGKPRVVTTDAALTLDAVYRCVNIITTLMSSLEIVAVNRQGKELQTQPGLIRRPELDSPRYTTIKQTTSSLAMSGEFFWYLPGRQGPTSPVTAIELLNPQQVQIRRDQWYKPVYSMFDQMTGQWKDLPRWQIQHGKLLEVPGALHGRGPLQACQAMLRGAIDLTEFAGNWWTEGTPTGTLSTDQELNPDLADEYRKRWHDAQERKDIAILGSGFKFENNNLSPKDALYCEVDQANATKVARAFGVPAAAIDSNFQMASGTYINMSQRNTDMLTYTLSQYIQEIQNAFSEILPSGTMMKFLTDSLTTDLDAPRRWQGYGVATGRPFMTVNEVRALEGLDPIADGDVLASALAPTPVPATDQRTNTTSGVS